MPLDDWPTEALYERSDGVNDRIESLAVGDETKFHRDAFDTPVHDCYMIVSLPSTEGAEERWGL